MNKYTHGTAFNISKKAGLGLAITSVVTSGLTLLVNFLPFLGNSIGIGNFLNNPEWLIWANAGLSTLPVACAGMGIGAGVHHILSNRKDKKYVASEKTDVETLVREANELAEKAISLRNDNNKIRASYYEEKVRDYIKTLLKIQSSRNKVMPTLQTSTNQKDLAKYTNYMHDTQIIKDFLYNITNRTPNGKEAYTDYISKLLKKKDIRKNVNLVDTNKTDIHSTKLGELTNENLVNTSKKRLIKKMVREIYNTNRGITTTTPTPTPRPVITNNTPNDLYESLIDSYAEQLEERENKISALSRDNAKLKKDMSYFDSLIGTAKEEIDEKFASIQKKNKIIRKQESIINVKERAIKNAKDKSKAKVEALKGENEVLLDAVKDRNLENRIQYEMLEEQDKKIGSLGKKISNQAEYLKIKDEALDRAKQKASADRKRLHSSNEEKSQALTRKNQELKNYDSLVGSMKEDIDDKQSIIDRKEKVIRTVKAKAQDDKARLREEIDNSHNATANRNQELSRANRIADIRQEVINRKQAEIKKNSATIKTQNQTIKDQDANIQGLIVDNDILSAKNRGLQEENNMLNSHIRGLNEQITSQEQESERNQTKLNSIKNQVKDLKERHQRDALVKAGLKNQIKTERAKTQEAKTAVEIANYEKEQAILRAKREELRANTAETELSYAQYEVEKKARETKEEESRKKDAEAQMKEFDKSEKSYNETVKERIQTIAAAYYNETSKPDCNMATLDQRISANTEELNRKIQAAGGKPGPSFAFRGNVMKLYRNALLTQFKNQSNTFVQNNAYIGEYLKGKTSLDNLTDKQLSNLLNFAENHITDLSAPDNSKSL